MNKSFLKLIVFGIIILSFQLLFDFLLPTYAPDFKIVVKIHVFMFLITFIVIYVTNKITDKFSDKTGFVYLGFVLFKMMASVFFLFPFFSLELFQAKIVVLNFFVVFLSFIAFEAITIIKYLNLKQTD